ncbi:MAG: cobyrinate a,c-diamide synthase [Gammaproteobacteria bacterium]
MFRSRSCPALLISAPASGQGKTTLVAALARYHRQQGRRVRVFKTGPDFIDPTLLEQASGHPVYQLDLWMVGKRACRQLLYEAALEADLILVEGVMGLFDGDPSSADLAQAFGLPIALVIDSSAMAQTFGAVALGLANYRGSLTIAGVVANRVAGPGHRTMLQQSLPVSVPWLGGIAGSDTIQLPELHLGLQMADQIDSLEQKLDAASGLIANTELTQLPAPVSFSPAKGQPPPKCLKGVRIGVARDPAFCFVYPANLQLLEAMGAELRFFSPLTDTTLEGIDALYLPGGYPELFLDALADNQLMLNAINDFYAAGRPMVAECGGMLYLLDALQDQQGRQRALAGVITATARVDQRLAGIGLQGAEFDQGFLRGHTFHYAAFVEPPVFTATARRSDSSPAGGEPGEGLIRQRNLVASFLHWYFPSNPAASAALFLPSARPNAARVLVIPNESSEGR